MSSHAVQLLDRDAAIFTISVAAELAGMHPQTLRGYDRLGLVQPQRTRGRGRRYSPRDIVRLRLVQRLSQDEGINLNGIRRILELETALDQLRDEVDLLTRELAEAREAARAASEARVFTAEASGAVHLGRHVPRAPRALPARRS